jgi:hypothetical protein
VGADYIMRSTTDLSRVQDVLPLVEILTATETYFLNSLGKTTCKDTVHQVQEDTLQAVASAAVEEASDYSYVARTTPTRRTNLVENIALPFKVGRTQQLIQHEHGQNELARQTAKALIEWACAAEFDLLRSTQVSGASGTVPKMSGILESISKSTTVSNQASDTLFSASILKGLLKTSWDLNPGEPVTDLYMDSSLKQTFDTFTAGATKFIMSKEATLSDFVDVYDGGGFGRVAVHIHRLIYQSADVSRKVLGLRPDKFSIAYLERPHIVTDLAITGDFTPRAVVGKMTLECRSQISNFLATGFKV